MVRGLDLFKERFASFDKSYILIGGVACMLSMEKAGLSFRATKDLDIVLCVEALDRQFVETFWKFIKEGNYQFRQKSTGKKLFYRFYAPTNSFYPEILELFSRKPDAIFLRNDSHLTPIPVDKEISSLSAILLDKDYYQFIHEGNQKTEGLSIVGPTHLIPLKARAWLDLSAQSKAGNHVDEKDIRKHRSDIIKLYQLLSIDIRVHLTGSIRQDMKNFLEQIKNSPKFDLKSLGLKNTSLKDVLNTLSRIYDISLD